MNRSFATGCLAVLLGGLYCLPAQADETAPPLPEVRKPWPALYYPEKALQANQQGRALVEFEISPQGRVLEPMVTSTDPQGMFEATALNYIRELVFEVPADWDASGAAHFKFYFGFVFRLRPCQEPCREPEPYPADRSLMVTGKPLGSPPAAH